MKCGEELLLNKHLNTGPSANLTNALPTKLSGLQEFKLCMNSCTMLSEIRIWIYDIWSDLITQIVEYLPSKQEVKS